MRSTALLSLKSESAGDRWAGGEDAIANDDDEAVGGGGGGRRGRVPSQFASSEKELILAVFVNAVAVAADVHKRKSPLPLRTRGRV